MRVPIAFNEAWEFNRAMIADMLAAVGNTFKQQLAVEFDGEECAACVRISFAGFGERERLFEVVVELRSSNLEAEEPTVRPLITCYEIECATRVVIHQLPIYEEGDGYFPFDAEARLRRALEVLAGKPLRRLCAKINERLTDHAPQNLRTTYRK